MKKILLTLFVFLVAASIHLYAQEKVVTGKVTSYMDGTPIPGVSVVIKGTTKGTVTDVNGEYKLSVPEDAILVFTFVGMTKEEVDVKGKNSFDLAMTEDIAKLSEVVVTALGISREKKSLGYSTQELSGDQINTVKSDNFMNSLSGKVAGVQIKKTTNMGGSTNIVLRGNKSLTGNNQVLFVIDGVPINNDNTNTSSQSQAGQGFDFGNAGSDINPDDIESINILKGSAATSLYGSRAAGGVVLIVTKKGLTAGNLKKGFGVTLNSGITMGFIDKSTFPKYQQEYGAGYGTYYDGPGNYWYMRDLNGDGIDEQWVVTSEDASYGAPFDPSLMVYQWNAVDPESPNYMKPTPWIAAKNGPITFLKRPVTYNNSIAIDNAANWGNSRLSYTNYKQDGMMPNSQLKKDNILLNATFNVTDKLTASGSANYIKTNGLGRNSTGYSDNIMTSFRQWYQINVDTKELEDAYNTTHRNVTWNWADPSDAQPIFWDNPYWTRYENYESDNRNRFIGNMALNYKFNDWLSIYGRASGDAYNELQEERRAVGSIAGPFGIGNGTDGSLQRSDQKSGYLRRDYTFSEYNYDLMLNFNKNLSDNFNLKGVLGSNTRRTNYSRLISATNGGLSVPGLYSIQNSIGPLPYSKELETHVGVNGLFGQASLGFKNMLYLDVTLRRDHSSTLPENSNVYYYPSVAGSYIFSTLAPDSKWLSFGKVRLSYAEAGNGADFAQLNDIYNIITPLNSPITSVDGIKKNPDLKEERTKTIEGGFEMYFFSRRVGLDVSLYKMNTINQILPLALSTSTGYNSMIINAGEIQNKGVEVVLMTTPIKATNFKWDCNFNWSKNNNKVLSLYEGLTTLQLGSFQGGVTINAEVGQPYGVIYGTDYTYLHPDNPKPEERLINPANGRYIMSTTSDNIIGNINPDWNGGVLNSFSYKNWNFSFLIDMQKGGDIFSLDMYYGLATGLYEETSYTNDLGNPVRNPIVGTPGNYDPSSGGFINEGVWADGTVNTTRIAASNYGAFGYARNPNSAFVYDAGYVKLREVALSYTLPYATLKDYFIKGATFSLVGSNVWIIHKNLPHADPESGLGSGNRQGYSVGSLPSTRDFGFNLKLNF
jgi:TonB-linked SusC/RagA family outer membrane protein